MRWDRKQIVEIYNELKRKVGKPTLRAFFYYLVSKQIIPNTKSAYKRLSRICVELRKKGLLTWDCFADKTRIKVKRYYDDKASEDDINYYRSRFEEKLKELDIDKLLDEYFPRCYLHSEKWADQEYYVCIALEKEALKDFVDSAIRDLEVDLYVNRGYPSWTFLYDLCKELAKYKHKKIVILYLGDLDPSGVDIERFQKEAIEYFNIEFKLERVAITEEQVEKYNLPPKPEDVETLEKIKRDPRSKSYKKSYIVELDALVAYAPDDFRKIIKDAISKYFDDETYKRVQEETKKIKEKLEQIRKEFIEKAKEKLKTMLSS